MGITFSTLSRATQVALKATSSSQAEPVAFPLGHIHEALAAALGYNTHAALKAAIQANDESVNYDDATHIVLDVARLEQRLTALNQASLSGVVAAAIREAFASMLPEARLHSSVTDLGDDISAEVIDAIENSDGYSGEMAMTNAYGGDFDIGFTEPVPIDTARGQWTLEASGTSSLEQDPEKVFHGDTLEVYATVVFEKIGRRVLGDMSVEEAGGWIADLEEDVDDGPFDVEPDNEGGVNV